MWCCLCHRVLVCAGRKQWARALELFLQGLTAPTMVCSAITAATYKKYALVSLIHAGGREVVHRTSKLLQVAGCMLGMQ